MKKVLNIRCKFNSLLRILVIFRQLLIGYCPNLDQFWSIFARFLLDSYSEYSYSYSNHILISAFSQLLYNYLKKLALITFEPIFEPFL